MVVYGLTSRPADRLKKSLSVEEEDVSHLGASVLLYVLPYHKLPVYDFIRPKFLKRMGRHYIIIRLRPLCLETVI